MSTPYLLHIIGWNPFFVCKLHYFNTLITSNTAIHNYCESENGISERLKERKIFMKKHYTQHRKDLFFPLQKWLVSHSSVAERAHKTCIIAYTTWLSPEKVLGTSSLIIWFHSYRSLSPGCMFGQRHDDFLNFFSLFTLCRGAGFLFSSCIYSMEEKKTDPWSSYLHKVQKHLSQDSCWWIEASGHSATDHLP